MGEEKSSTTLIYKSGTIWILCLGIKEKKPVPEAIRDLLFN